MHPVYGKGVHPVQGRLLLCIYIVFVLYYTNSKYPYPWIDENLCDTNMKINFLEYLDGNRDMGTTLLCPLQKGGMTWSKQVI